MAKIAVWDVKLINWLDNHTSYAAKALCKARLAGTAVTHSDLPSHRLCTQLYSPNF